MKCKWCGKDTGNDRTMCVGCGWDALGNALGKLAAAAKVLNEEAHKKLTKVLMK